MAKTKSRPFLTGVFLATFAIATSALGFDGPGPDSGPNPFKYDVTRGGAGTFEDPFWEKITTKAGMFPFEEWYGYRGQTVEYDDTDVSLCNVGDCVFIAQAVRQTEFKYQIAPIPPVNISFRISNYGTKNVMRRNDLTHIASGRVLNGDGDRVSEHIVDRPAFNAQGNRIHNVWDWTGDDAEYTLSYNLGTLTGEGWGKASVKDQNPDLNLHPKTIDKIEFYLEFQTMAPEYSSEDPDSPDAFAGGERYAYGFTKRPWSSYDDDGNEIRPYGIDVDYEESSANDRELYWALDSLDDRKRKANGTRLDFLLNWDPSTSFDHEMFLDFTEGDLWPTVYVPVWDQSYLRDRIAGWPF